MKKIFFIVLVVALFLSGCSKGLNKEEVQKFADPMTENMLQGLNEDDYEKFSKDFGPLMQSALTEQAFDEVLKAQIKDVIGNYENMEIGKVTSTSNEGVDYIVVIYKAKFDKEPGDVAVTVWFTNEEEDRKIETLLFNSPKLVESSTK